jgi:hypothetical protein
MSGNRIHLPLTQPDVKRRISVSLSRRHLNASGLERESINTAIAFAPQIDHLREKLREASVDNERLAQAAIDARGHAALRLALRVALDERELRRQEANELRLRLEATQGHKVEGRLLTWCRRFAVPIGSRCRR